jgi:hypothetical protein
MKTIYLHIGTFKTGTTSIQKYLKDHKDELEEEGYFYPFPIKPGRLAHHDLPLSIIKDFTSFRAPGWPEFDETMEECWGNIFRQIESSRCDKVIISSECFCDLVNESVKEEEGTFSKIIRDMFLSYNVKVVCYIRDVSKYAVSRYGETLKISSLDISLNREVGNFFKNDSIHINPKLYLDFFGEIFGKDSIIVREYSREKLHNEDAVSDFLRLIGAPSKKSAEYLSNKSIDPEDFVLKRIVNSAGFLDSSFNMLLSDLLIKVREEKVAVKKEIFDADSKNKINDVHKSINEEYGVELPLYDDLSHVKEGDGAETLQYYLLSLISLLLKQNRRILHELSEIKQAIGK